jgi:hypothetical protein
MSYFPPAFTSFILPDVANDFDPTVGNGLVARVGAMVGTIDGSKAWLKTSVADIGWTPIGS